MASPNWIRPRREPGLPGFGGASYAGSATATATSPAVDETLRGANRLIEAKTREAEAAAAATIVDAVVHGNKNQQPAQVLDQSERIMGVANGLVDMQGKQVEIARADAARYKEESGQAYQSGYSEAEERGQFFITVLDKSHEREVEAMRAAQQMVDKIREDNQTLIRTLDEKVNTIILSNKDAEIARLNAEVERLKAGGAAGGAAAVPLVGYEARALPDGRLVYVQTGAAAGNGGSDLARIKESLGHLRELKAAMDEISGGPRPTVDPDDPTRRWQHKQIDWEEEARKREEDRKDRVASAQVAREESITKAVDSLPDLLKRHGPKVAAAVVGGAPERGSYNGMPERPPMRRRPAPAAQEVAAETGVTAQTPPPPPPPQAEAVDMLPLGGYEI